MPFRGFFHKLRVEAQWQPPLQKAPCTGAHLPPLVATSDQAPTGAPPTRDKVPLLCDHLRHPMWQPPHPGCGTLTRQHPSPPYPIHMGSPVPLLTTVTHVQ